MTQRAPNAPTTRHSYPGGRYTFLCFGFGVPEEVLRAVLSEVMTAKQAARPRGKVEKCGSQKWASSS